MRLYPAGHAAQQGAVTQRDEDGVERSWELMMPVLENPPPVAFYEPGTWGPEEAEDLIAPRHWHITKPRE